MSIDFDLLDNIALITINRPESRNALDLEHYEALSDAWSRVRDDNDIRAAIVTGAGDKAFCAGADLKSYIGRNPELSELWLTQKAQLLNRGLEVWKPVIAAVNGACVGGGMTLLLATDIRIAVRDARIGVTEVQHGVIPANGGTQRLLQQIPHCVAMEMLLTGQPISAEKAERWGLINAVVEREALLERAFEYAHSISANAPLAVQAVKELALRSRDMGLSAGLRMEQFVSRILQTSEDVGRAREAFANKQKPEFHGK